MSRLLPRGEDMEGALYKAVVEDNPARLRRLLEYGGDANTSFEDTTRISAKSILHVCCEKGRMRCVKTLLEYGANASKQGTWGQTPLMLCVMMEYLEIAELLLQSDPECSNAQDAYGNTPLHIAIGNVYVDAVKLLLNYDANVDIMNTHGVSPVMALCAIKNCENAGQLLRMMLDAGAMCDLKDFGSRRTALQLTAVSKNPETVEMLLNAGADPNTVDNGGRTPLTNILMEHVRGYSVTKEIDPDVLTIVHMLVHFGADLNLCSHEYTNALIMATSLKCPPLVNYFLENGADQTIKFFANLTPLLVAVTRNDVDTLTILLNWECDMYVKGRIMRRHVDFYRDPFELAVEQGFFEIAGLLAEYGYNLSRIDYLRDWIIEPPDSLKKDPEMLEYLRFNAVIPPSLFRCAVMRIRRTLTRDISNRANDLPLPKLLIRSF